MNKLFTVTAEPSNKNDTFGTHAPSLQCYLTETTICLSTTFDGTVAPRQRMERILDQFMHVFWGIKELIVLFAIAISISIEIAFWLFKIVVIST